MIFVSITRLRVRSLWFMPGFARMAALSARQAARAPGNLTVGFLREGLRIYWTSTSWESEAAMRAYMLAHPHKAAMVKLLHWCDEASVVHWTQPDPAPPTWAEAHARMQREGRPSKVNHPSEAHKAYIVPTPANFKGATRLK